MYPVDSIIGRTIVKHNMDDWNLHTKQIIPSYMIAALARPSTVHIISYIVALLYYLLLDVYKTSIIFVIFIQ